MKMYDGATSSRLMTLSYPSVSVSVGKKFWKPEAPVMQW